MAIKIENYPDYRFANFNGTNPKYSELVSVAKSLNAGAELANEDLFLIGDILNRDWRDDKKMLYLDNPEDVDLVARGVAKGFPVLHGFGNFLAISARPEPEVFRFVNSSKGRPLTQTSSVMALPDYYDTIWDFKKFPDGLTPQKAMDIMDDFYNLGPFGILAPSNDNIPDYLAQRKPGSELRQTQLIAPGYRCASIPMYRRIIDVTGLEYVTITSANISHTETGNKVEPAHYSMFGTGRNGAREDFAQRGYMMIAYPNEAQNRKLYPDHDPNSTSILGVGHITPSGNLILEREGSLPAAKVAKMLEKHGFGLEIGPNATNRQPLRSYN